MKINSDALAQSLKKKLAPVYLISGDEALLKQEALQQLRTQALQQGFTERKTLHAEAGFQWHDLLHEAASLSLFSSQKYIEVRLNKGAVTAEGAEVLQRCLESLSDQTLLAIICPRLEAGALKSRWYKKLIQMGVHVTVWPVERNRLPIWIRDRMQVLGLQPIEQVENILAELVEGNLLAAAQAIEKMALLYPAGRISEAMLLQMMTDEARFSAFDWVSYTLLGNTAKALRVLRHLREEGQETILILWAITREIRILKDLVQNHNAQAVFEKHKVWKQRQGPLLKAGQRLSEAKLKEALELCAQVDMAIKGVQDFCPWILLEHLTLGLTSNLAESYSGSLKHRLGFLSGA